ncbi:MAG TPA: YbhB/YbcL family Raf kinase inhibitor-like protein [Candidatus Acidoferrum sp.]|nr:YbhB/YbcL family Raf kinase inhibitor-like protein [Candidatus Acidoferrum sp.]
MPKKLANLTASFLCFSLAALAALRAQEKGGPTSLRITTPAFSAGGDIPKKFTCDGPDVSPKLAWNGAPEKTQAFALIVDDPDAPAGTWVHWVLFDLSANARELAEGVPKQEEAPGGAKQGRNDFGKIGYGGPCPPPGNPHRYFFKLYALEANLGLKAGATKAEVERAMKGHVLAQAELIGRYGR